MSTVIDENEFSGIVHGDHTIPKVQFREVEIGQIFNQSEFGTTWFVKTAPNHALPILNPWNVYSNWIKKVYFLDERMVRLVDFTP